MRPNAAYNLGTKLRKALLFKPPMLFDMEEYSSSLLLLSSMTWQFKAHKIKRSNTSTIATTGTTANIARPGGPAVKNIVFRVVVVVVVDCK